MNVSRRHNNKTPFSLDRNYATIVSPVQTTLRTIGNSRLHDPARSAGPSAKPPKLYFTDGQRTRDQAALPKVCNRRAAQRR